MRATRPAPVWLRVLIRLYPRELRRAHAAEMAEFVAMERARVRSERPAVRTAFVVRMTRDLVVGAARAHVSAVGTTPRRVRPGILQEVVFATRTLRRSPGFAATVVVTLGLGIGLSTAIFSALDAVLLRPLPYAQPERLVKVSKRLAETDDVLMAGGTLAKLRARTRAFEDLAGIALIRQNLTGTDLPRQVEVGWTTPNLFSMLGVEARLGRTFRTGDPMGTALLSHGSWQRDFGADPGVVGRPLQLDGYTYTVVGVLPADFEPYLGRVPRVVDVWKVPDTWWQNGAVWDNEGSEFGILRVIGRLAEGADLAVARSDLERLAEGLREEVPTYRRDGLQLSAEPLHMEVVSAARPILLLLMAAVVALVLIACANVAGLLLVRAEDREHDVAVRLALGSGRARVVAHVLAESALLAAAGGALGLVVGTLGTQLLPRIAPGAVPRLDRISVDARVLWFAAALTLSCTLLVGMAPAIGAARRSPRGVLASARTTSDRRRLRVRATLVVAQIAASLVLVVCAGLLASSLGRLERVDAGIDADGVVTFAISLPGVRYGWPVEADQFFQRFEERLRALPGVTDAALVWPLPLNLNRWDGAFHGGVVREEERLHVRYELATPSYFRTLGIGLEGETFGTRDPKRAVIVSRTLAERAWPGEHPIGRTLRAFPWGRDTVHFEVIGVADDVRYVSLRDAPTPVIYFHSAGYAWTDWEVDFVVRTAQGDASALAPRIRAELAALDNTIPVARLRPLRELVDAELATNRFARLVFGLFAVVAALLALLGLYGVIAYGVRRRTREFGIRMALGSGGMSILGLVLRSGVLLAGAGVAIGLVAALWAAGLLRGLLYGVTARDPWMYGAAAIAMTAVAIVASVAPARRAARLDPASVLRSE